MHSNDRAVRTTITAYQCGTCTTLEAVQLDNISKAVALIVVTLCGGGIRTTLHSNDRAVKTTITAYQSGTCTTLESVQSDLISKAVVLLDVTLCGG